jgi:hypothetical protein
LALKALSTGSTLTGAADVVDDVAAEVVVGLELEVDAASAAGGGAAAPDEQADSATATPTPVIKTNAGFAIIKSLPVFRDEAPRHCPRSSEVSTAPTGSTPAGHSSTTRLH